MSDLNTCPVCRKVLPVEGAAFCPFCGAAQVKEAPLPPAVREALANVQQTEDPVKKHRLLTAIRESYPDCLAVETEILHLGRLYERDPRHPTYDVIKCYLLHAYLTPSQFSVEKRNAMRDELFSGEQLKRCQALSPDAFVFTRAYLERLSSEFIHLFLEGSNQYMRNIFGFSIGRNPAKLLAVPAAQMLSHMQDDALLADEDRALLMNALYAAFARQADNHTEFLLEELDKYGCVMPR